MNEKKQEVVRPLAFELARELKAEEVAAIAGGRPLWTLGDINPPNQAPWYDHHH